MAKRRPVKTEAMSLKGLIKSDPEFLNKFSEAEKLSRAIFEPNESRVALPYFTDHGIEHCKGVETHLDKILFGNQALGAKDFVPTREEAMYLLAAACLHDVGMIYGIFDNENPSDLGNNPEEIKNLRDEHEVRTSRYILEQWKLNCSWSPEEKALLANICHFHRRRNDIRRFKPAKTTSRYDGKPIRLKVLAALLRLADGCDVDQFRAPGFLRAFYDSVGMPPEGVSHWETSKMISHVYFDHAERRIELVALSPPVLDFQLGKFDLRDLVEGTRGDVEEELRSVYPVLMDYLNTRFQEVDCTINPVNALAVKTRQRCLAVWPYLLHKPCSATEICAALVQLLLFAAQETKDFGQAWRDKVGDIMSEALRSRPFDFMVKNLCFEIGKIISQDAFAETGAYELTKYLKDYLQNSSKMCRDLAAHMTELVDNDDAIIVYGYSTNVAEFLENIRRRHAGPVYIVDCHNPTGKTGVGLDANERITDLALNLGFKVYFVDLPDLAQVLQGLKRDRVSCKLVLGTHGVLENGDFACKTGTHILAITAGAFGAQVLAFAESKKFLANGENDIDVLSPQKLLSSKDSKIQLGTTKVRCLTAELDIVPCSLVDAVVTERGVRKTWARTST